MKPAPVARIETEPEVQIIRQRGQSGSD
jgi:hypothetical protein